MCYGRTVTIPIAVHEFCSKQFNSYRTGFWLSNIIARREFGIESYLEGGQPSMEDDL